MRWAVFLVAAVVAVVLDVSFLDGLAPDNAREIRPSITAVLAVLLTLSAPRTTALWACFLLGLALDLSLPVISPAGSVWYLVGPHTLGYVAAGYLVVRSRPVLFRQRALTIGVVTLGFVVVMSLVSILLFTVRSIHPGEPDVGWTDGSIARAIGIRLLIAIYSGVVAVPVGWGLVKSIPLWGFAATGPNRH